MHHDRQASEATAAVVGNFTSLGKAQLQALGWGLQPCSLACAAASCSSATRGGAAQAEHGLHVHARAAVHGPAGPVETRRQGLAHLVEGPR